MCETFCSGFSFGWWAFGTIDVDKSLHEALDDGEGMDGLDSLTRRRRG